MKDSIRTAFLLLAPCVVLGGLAVLMSRRPTAPFLSSSNKPPLGPFSIAVAGVETQKLLPVSVYEGFDRHFHMLFRDKGERPKWWGKPISSRSGTQMKGWRFWLERGGRRTAFRLTETQIWTTGWDDKKKRYFNEFLLHCGEVPADAALKMSGQTQLSIGGGSTTTTFSDPLPFEVTLKKAGTKWDRPHFALDPGMKVQSIQVSRLANGMVTAKIKGLPSSGITSEDNKNYNSQLLDLNWKELPGYWLSTCSSSLFSPELNPSKGTRFQTSDLSWKAADIAKTPAPDVILSQRYSINGRWPLEIAFAVKKNGQLVFGKVPLLTRPRGK